MIRIPGNIDRIIEKSKMDLNKDKNVDSVISVKAIDNKFNSDNGNSNENCEEFSKMLDEAIVKRKKH